MPVITNNKNIYNNYFEKINTPEKAYWLGFIAGDGSIGIYGKYNSKRFSIGLQNKDSEHVYKLANAMDCINNVYMNKNDYVLQKSCKKLFNDLYKHKIRPRKTHTIDGSVIPKDFKFDFIRGIFDADGCMGIYNKKESNNGAIRAILLFSGNYPLLETIQKIIDNGGRLAKSKRTNALSYGGRFNIEKTGNKFYYDNCVCLKRKYDIFKKICEYNTEHKKGMRKNRTFNIYINGRGYIERVCKQCNNDFITRIDRADKGETYGRFCSRKCANRYNTRKNNHAS